MLTLTVGSVKYLAASLITSARNCSGVRPAACISLSTVSDTLPSGLTGTSLLDDCSSFQKITSSTSSGPITYPGGGVMPLVAGGAAAAAVDTGAGAPVGATVWPWAGSATSNPKSAMALLSENV